MTHKVFRISLLLICLSLFLVFPAAASSIGYVDYEFLFNAHPEYTSKNQEFVAMVDKYSKEFQLAAEGITDQAQYNEIMDSYDNKIAEAAGELRRYIVESMSGYINQVAEEHNVEVVLLKTTVLYGGVDLTSLVVEAMYRSYGISVPSHLRNY